MNKAVNLKSLRYPKEVEFKTVFDVYKTWDVPIPEGYRVVAFRPVRTKGELLLNVNPGSNFKLSTVNWRVDKEDARFPALIVEKLPPQPRKHKVLKPIRHDWKFKEGEYYFCVCVGAFEQADRTFEDKEHGYTDGTAYELVEEEY